LNRDPLGGISVPPQRPGPIAVSPEITCAPRFSARGFVGRRGSGRAAATGVIVSPVVLIMSWSPTITGRPKRLAQVARGKSKSRSDGPINDRGQFFGNAERRVYPTIGARNLAVLPAVNDPEAAAEKNACAMRRCSSRSTALMVRLSVSKSARRSADDVMGKV
jgi:hypothetical protein